MIVQIVNNDLLSAVLVVVNDLQNRASQGMSGRRALEAYGDTELTDFEPFKTAYAGLSAKLRPWSIRSASCRNNPPLPVDAKASPTAAGEATRAASRRRPSSRCGG
jgi:hypothetical protein